MSKPPVPPKKTKPVRFSYSTADQPFLQRALIQVIEKIGGQHKLKSLYRRHLDNMKRGEGFLNQ